MRVRDRLRVLGLLGVVGAMFVVALDMGCARATDGPGAAVPREVAPAEIVTVAPLVTRVEEVAPSPVVSRKPPVRELVLAPDDSMFPSAWRSPPPSTASFSDEVTMAHGLRGQMRALSRAPRAPHPSSDAGTDAASLAWLSKLLELRERADRAYASAWVAQDATPEGKIEVLSEATTMAQDLQRTLTDAGYEEIPAAWKADPTLHATFEDIAHGPVRRLGEESRALAFFCVSSADRDHVRGHSADSCRRAAGATAMPSRDPDKACACAKGDPLCTTTDWCK